MSCCEVCNSKVAALYCKADLAKLCLLCDHDIHSANALSLRHTRSQICDHCRAEAASIVCYSHNISLCRNCDRESHSHCSADSAPVQGFLGCPSAMELASMLGFDHLGAENFIKFNSAGSSFLLDDHNKLMDLHDDLMVPSAAAYSTQSLGSCPRKGKDEVYEQLVEMRMRALAAQVLEIEDAASISELATRQLQHTPIKSTPLLVFPMNRGYVVKSYDHIEQLEDAPSQNNQSVDQAGTTPASEMNLNSNERRLEVVMDGRRSTSKSNSKAQPHNRCNARSRYNKEEEKKTTRYNRHARDRSRKSRLILARKRVKAPLN